MYIQDTLLWDVNNHCIKNYINLSLFLLFEFIGVTSQLDFVYLRKEMSWEG